MDGKLTLCSIKPRPIFCKPTFLLQVMEQFSPGLEVHHEEEFHFTLKAKLETQQEGAFTRSLKNFSLSNGMLNFFLGDDFSFGQDFHSVDPFGVLFAYLKDSPKGPFAYHSEELEIRRT